MKLLIKLGLVGVLAGVGATALSAAPTGIGDPAMSPQLGQAMAESQQLREQISNDARHVQHLQMLARREKDVIKLNCVNDKLVQLRPELNLADRAATELQGGLMSAMGQITDAARTVRRLREAADQCIGEPGLGDESYNSYTHPNIFDPTGEFPNWGATFEPPAYASPMD